GRERSPRLRSETDLPPPLVGPATPIGAPASNARPGVMQCLTFSPDSAILAGGSDWPGSNGESTLAAVHLWNVARGEELLRIPAHQGNIGSLAFSPVGEPVHWMACTRDGKTLLLGSPGRPGSQWLRLWSVAERREIRRLSR